MDGVDLINLYLDIGGDGDGRTGVGERIAYFRNASFLLFFLGFLRFCDLDLN